MSEWLRVGRLIQYKFSRVAVSLQTQEVLWFYVHINVQYFLIAAGKPGFLTLDCKELWKHVGDSTQTA